MAISKFFLVFVLTSWLCTQDHELPATQVTPWVRMSSRTWDPVSDSVQIFFSVARFFEDFYTWNSVLLVSLLLPFPLKLADKIPGMTLRRPERRSKEPEAVLEPDADDIDLLSLHSPPPPRVSMTTTQTPSASPLSSHAKVPTPRSQKNVICVKAQTVITLPFKVHPPLSSAYTYSMNIRSLRTRVTLEGCSKIEKA